MSQASPKPQIRGGVPWWLWTLIVIATAVIGLGVVMTSMPVDPQQLYKSALQTVQSDQTSDQFEKELAQLSNFAEYESHVLLLKR